MLSEIPYANFADFAPRPSTDVERKSKTACAQIKRPNNKLIEDAITRFFVKDAFEPLRPFLNPNVTLIPIPRSAPMVDGAAWPPLTIAQLLAKHGYGKTVYPCLKRATRIVKSSLQKGAANRPMVADHYNSLRVDPELLVPEEITLIDDVVTAGRTAFACAQRVQEAFPEATIRLFAMMRTQSFDPVPEVIVFGTGRISFNPGSGKTSRYP